MRIIVETKNIKKSFGLTVAIQGISIKIRANEFVAILGKSGSGKSTLFQILDGSLIPDSGTVIIDNKDVYKMKRGDFLHIAD